MPALRVTPPVPVVMGPLTTIVPVPALVSAKFADVTPPTDNALVVPFTVTVRAALRVTWPRPRLSALLPVKAKLPFQLCALFVSTFTVEPLVLSIVPPAIVSAPVPRAEFK